MDGSASSIERHHMQRTSLHRIAPAAVVGVVALALVAATSAWSAATNPTAKATPRPAAVTISGGMTTDARDHGRPVVLIAAALGVPTEVFRTAFSGVRPADPSAGPTGEEAQANKAALLAVLAPYGVTNERLDEVSNYYRYNGSAGETWKHQSATARATVRNGKVVAITITRAGRGYTSAPTIRVAGYPKLRVVAKLRFTTNLATNGSIASATVAG